MPSNESPSSSVVQRGRVGSDPLRTIVWIRGGHDVATSERLSVTLTEAEAIDDVDIVVDLSAVTFMDASTIGTLIGAHNRLRDRSRSLSVRHPSPSAWRLLDLCGLAQLIDEDPTSPQPPGATALGSWVEVPALDRGSKPARSTPPQFTPPSVAPARSVQRGRTLW